MGSHVHRKGRTHVTAESMGSFALQTIDSPRRGQMRPTRSDHSPPILNQRCRRRHQAIELFLAFLLFDFQGETRPDDARRQRPEGNTADAQARRDHLTYVGTRTFVTIANGRLRTRVEVNRTIRFTLTMVMIAHQRVSAKL